MPRALRITSPRSHPARARRGVAVPVLLLVALAWGCGGTDQAVQDGSVGASDPEAAPSAAPSAPTDTIHLLDLGHPRGAATAPITVVEFSDYGCPYCARFAFESYPALHEEFVDTGLVRWIFVPFVIGSFPNGELAARVGECAADQDRFWVMKDVLYREQQAWKGASAAQVPSRFTRLAADAGLDAQAFQDCVGTNRTGPTVALHTRAAGAVGVRATPSFLVNGRLVEGALPVEQFREILTGMVARAGR
jgi:protein-disulfide isomerase